MQVAGRVGLDSVAEGVPAEYCILARGGKEAWDVPGWLWWAGFDGGWGPGCRWDWRGGAEHCDCAGEADVGSDDDEAWLFPDM